MSELAKTPVELDKASCAADHAVQPTKRSLRGLDWLNFLLADVQTGVGPFLAIYLAGYGWNEERVGLALTVGGIAGILAQTPAGALVDQVHRKRTLIAAGVGGLALGALLIAFVPTFWSVMWAHLLIGGISSIFGTLFEYCLAVPANRLGFVQFSRFQLKIIQEVITISVFIVFASFFLKEKLAWNYLVAFAFLCIAAFFAFAFKAPGSVV